VEGTGGVEGQGVAREGPSGNPSPSPDARGGETLAPALDPDTAAEASGFASGQTAAGVSSAEGGTTGEGRQTGAGRELRTAGTEDVGRGMPVEYGTERRRRREERPGRRRPGEDGGEAVGEEGEGEEEEEGEEAGRPVPGEARREDTAPEPWSRFLDSCLQEAEAALDVGGAEQGLGQGRDRGAGEDGGAGKGRGAGEDGGAGKGRGAGEDGGAGKGRGAGEDGGAGKGRGGGEKRRCPARVYT